MSVEDVTRRDFDRALSIYMESKNRVEFLKKFRMGKNSLSRTTFLFANEQYIDAKAVLRASHLFTKYKAVLPWDSFYGGLPTIEILKKLGFKKFYYRGKFINFDDEYENVDVSEKSGPPFDIALIRRRRGQQAFRQALLAAYESTCCITGSVIVELLEAAHISPFSTEMDHSINNGLLLRADIHTLFDLGLLWIDPEKYVVKLHASIQDSEYKIFEGQKLSLPRNPEHAPDKKLLQRKNE